MRPSLAVVICLIVAVSVGVPLVAVFGQLRPQPAARVAALDPNLSKIKHIVIITQENRSFDHYFGTFPGAEGIPIRDGASAVCVQDQRAGRCVAPYLDHSDRQSGGPHFPKDAREDIDGGKMDGFIAMAQAKRPKVDVMSYHDGGDIPNYWAWAKGYVLQDHFFEPMATWSLPTHAAMVSAWAAHCRNQADPMSCVGALLISKHGPKHPTPYAWTDITYVLKARGVSWASYLDGGPAEQHERGQGGDTYARRGGVPAIWNVLPGFVTVNQDNQLGNIQDLSNFFTAAKDGTLPAVSWILPSFADSEHPPALISRGQSYVTGLVNAIMASPDWSSTAIFLWWDDWGGFYDHLPPPVIDQLGLGIRVPGLVISPYAKRGYIDHQVLSTDSYLRFIEDVFLGGQRLDPHTDGRPDSRPSVRENWSGYGDIINDFDFSSPPRAAVPLPANPHTNLQAGG